MKFTRLSRMPRLITVATLLFVLAAFAVVAIAMQEQEPAVFLGQGNLDQGVPNFINKFGFDAPVSVAIDTSVSPNHVYVADLANNRVLGFQSASGFINGTGAVLFFGEHNPGAINDYQSGFSASTLFHPSGVAVDSHGNVFIADSGANRVLEYNAPFVPQPLQQPVANEVFGTCGDFLGEGAGCTGGTGAATLNNPTAVAIDGDNLWVVDAGNNRIVEYANPVAGGSNITASVVLGQLGSFASHDNADRLLRQLKAQGFSAFALPGGSGPHIADVKGEEDRVDNARLDPETPTVAQNRVNEEKDRVCQPDIAGIALGADVQASDRSVGLVAHDSAARDPKCTASGILLSAMEDEPAEAEHE